jgi:hypothetical protein
MMPAMIPADTIMMTRMVRNVPSMEANMILKKFMAIRLRLYTKILKIRRFGFGPVTNPDGSGDIF